MHAINAQSKHDLIPIEALKMGDLVLSRDENNPHAPIGYKPFTKTYNSECKIDIDVIMLRKNRDDNPFDITHDAGCTTFKRKYEDLLVYPLFCTREHPFYDLNKKQWQWFGEINFYHQTFLADLTGSALRVGNDYCANQDVNDLGGKNILEASLQYLDIRSSIDIHGSRSRRWKNNGRKVATRICL